MMSNPVMTRMVIVYCIYSVSLLIGSSLVQTRF
jgi:hypothetical protein